MTIVGVILCFRQLGQNALNDVLNHRVPFLLSSIIDFKEHFPVEEGDSTVFFVTKRCWWTYIFIYNLKQLVNEMASAAGLPCIVDPVLITALKVQRTGIASWSMLNLNGHPNYVYLRHQRRRTFSRLFAARLRSRCVTSLSSSWAFIFPVIIILAFFDWKVLCDWGVYFCIFRASLEGHANNAHCLAAAVNTVLCALFALAGRRDTEERLKEFLAVNWFRIIVFIK